MKTRDLCSGAPEKDKLVSPIFTGKEKNTRTGMSNPQRPLHASSFRLESGTHSQPCKIPCRTLLGYTRRDPQAQITSISKLSRRFPPTRKLALDRAEAPAMNRIRARRRGIGEGRLLEAFAAVGRKRPLWEFMRLLRPSCLLPDQVFDGAERRAHFIIRGRCGDGRLGAAERLRPNLLGRLDARVFVDRV